MKPRMSSYVANRYNVKYERRRSRELRLKNERYLRGWVLSGPPKDQRKAINKRIGSQLYSYRMIKMFERKDVAYLLDISPETYRMMENGTNTVPLWVIKRLSELYSVSEYCLFMTGERP